MAVTYGVVVASVPAWWVLPAAVVIVLLPMSLWREVRTRRQSFNRAMTKGQ